MKTIKIGNRKIGEKYPAFVVAEIGINHNGDVKLVKQLIDIAKISGCDAVKFQKRDPELCVPMNQRKKKRETPWGYITYMDYRYKVEFGKKEYKEIDRYCREKDIMWFASVWDKNSVDFMDQFDTPCFKIPSAALTDDELLLHIKKKKKPVILSTGMSDLPLIKHAIKILGEKNLIILHANSTYPAKIEELNLTGINTLKRKFPKIQVGYSGHEAGINTTYAAVVLGAPVIERHITIDRAMWGTDQSASVELEGMRRLVRYIRQWEVAKGDGNIKIYKSELPIIERLRKNKVKSK
jgi:N-acetylneuraminate synthase|tara:strand:- start:1236 stop:2120 length:885 start_codon:yes stop_codon:yes gene_type:complete